MQDAQVVTTVNMYLGNDLKQNKLNRWLDKKLIVKVFTHEILL